MNGTKLGRGGDDEEKIELLDEMDKESFKGEHNGSLIVQT